jgi:hypothetical protein
MGNELELADSVSADSSSFLLLALNKPVVTVSFLRDVALFLFRHCAIFWLR